ncbi:MAG: Dehydrogenases with different specificities (related to short-chain alcohol dehydrogenases), partial [uncultured Thermomicrobiales bacterium]
GRFVEKALRSDHRPHRRLVRDRPRHGAAGGPERRQAGAGGAQRRRLIGVGHRVDRRRRAGCAGGRRCGQPRRRAGDRPRRARGVRRVRHLGQQRRGLDLRHDRGGPDRGHAPRYGDQFLGGGLRLQGGAAGAQGPRRRLDQPGQHRLRPGVAAARDLLRLQARDQGVHRRAEDGAGGRGRAGLGQPDQAGPDRHPVPPQRQELPGNRAEARPQGLRAGGRRPGDPALRRTPDPGCFCRRQRQRPVRARLPRPPPSRQADGAPGDPRDQERRAGRSARRQRARSPLGAADRTRQLPRPRLQDQPLHDLRPAPGGDAGRPGRGRCRRRGLAGGAQRQRQRQRPGV